MAYGETIMDYRDINKLMPSIHATITTLLFGGNI